MSAARVPEIPDTTLVNTAWGSSSWRRPVVKHAGPARYSHACHCFVDVVAPGTIAMSSCGPRVIAAGDGWVAVEDCVGASVAEVVAAVGLSAINDDHRRFIFDTVALAVRAAGGIRVPTLDRILIGFDGRVVVVAAPRAADDIAHADDEELGVLALSLDVVDAADVKRAGGRTAMTAKAHLEDVVTTAFPARASAWRQAVVIASRPAPPSPPPPPTPAQPVAMAATPVTTARTALALDALIEGQVQPATYVNLMRAIDGDDARSDRWQHGQAAPPDPSPEECRRLAAPARLARVAATFGQVLAALSVTSPAFVYLGAPKNVFVGADGVSFAEHRRLQDEIESAPRTLDKLQFRYLAPEQALGAALDVRGSLYVVGVHLYELCCGRHPFHAETSVGFAFLHAKRSPPPPVSVNPGLPQALGELIMRLMAKDPQDRYPAPKEALVALAHAMGHVV